MEKYSKPIEADEYGYYMSCPEFVAEHIAEQLSEYKTAVELCCAVGMTVVQLAKAMDKVVGIDIDPNRIENAKHNAELYNVSNKTEFVVGDVLDESLLKNIRADVAVLDPDWKNGGKTDDVASLDGTIPSLRKMVGFVRKHITQNIVARVPKTFTMGILAEIGACRLENIVFEGRVRFKIAYFLPGIKNQEVTINFD